MSSQFFYYLSIASNFFPIVTFFSLKKEGDIILFKKILILFFILISIIDLFSYLWIFLFHWGNNMPFMHLIGLIEGIFISLIYYNYVSTVILRKMIYFIGILVNLFAVFVGILIEGIYNYPSIAQAPIGIMVILWSLLGFYELMNKNQGMEIYKEEMFWINSAFLIYFAGTFFLFLLSNYLIQTDSKAANSFWMINLFLNILVNIFYCIGIKKGNNVKNLNVDPIKK